MVNTAENIQVDSMDEIESETNVARSKTDEINDEIRRIRVSIHPQNDSDLLPLFQLRDICSACFGNPRAEIAFICFDGNFQHKRLATKNEASDLSCRDLRDKRIFVDGEPCIFTPDVLALVFMF